MNTAYAAIAGVAAGLGWSVGRNASIGKPELRSGFNVIPNVPVLTHEGQSVRFYDDLVKGRVVMLNVMYATCGDSCPLITQNLRRVQELLGDRMGRDLFMYSITLQPEIDTVQKLRTYARLFQLKPGWQFLTGKRADIEQLRIALGFYDPDPIIDASLSQHTGILRYGNERLNRWAGCPAMARPQGIVSFVLSSMVAGAEKAKFT